MTSKRLALLDTNLLLVLIVGRADLSYLSRHKRTSDYDDVDFHFIERLISVYDGVATTPHILTETSNLLRQIGNPARDLIQEQFRRFILQCGERLIASRNGCTRVEFLPLGLTDAVILATCEMGGDDGETIELLTADEPIFNSARALDLPAELYA